MTKQLTCFSIRPNERTNYDTQRVATKTQWNQKHAHRLSTLSTYAILQQQEGLPADQVENLSDRT